MNAIQKRLKVIIAGARMSDNKALEQDLEKLYKELDELPAKNEDPAIRPPDDTEKRRIDQAILHIFKACAIDLRESVFLIEERASDHIPPKGTLVISLYAVRLPTKRLAVEILSAYARTRSLFPEAFLAEKLISIYES